MTDSERQALLIIARGRPDNGRALASAEAQAVARAALIAAGADWTKQGTGATSIDVSAAIGVKREPTQAMVDAGVSAVPDLTERLGEMLAQVADAVLLTVQDVANSRDVELTLGSFRKDLGEAAAALLEEAGY